MCASLHTTSLHWRSNANVASAAVCAKKRGLRDPRRVWRLRRRRCWTPNSRLAPAEIAWSTPVFVGMLPAHPVMCGAWKTRTDLHTHSVCQKCTLNFLAQDLRTWVLRRLVQSGIQRKAPTTTQTHGRHPVQCKDAFREIMPGGARRAPAPVSWAAGQLMRGILPKCTLIALALVPSVVVHVTRV